MALHRDSITILERAVRTATWTTVAIVAVCAVAVAAGLYVAVA